MKKYFVLATAIILSSNCHSVGNEKSEPEIYEETIQEIITLFRPRVFNPLSVSIQLDRIFHNYCEQNGVKNSPCYKKFIQQMAEDSSLNKKLSGLGKEENFKDCIRNFFALLETID